jgi:uridine kinase
MGQHATLIIGIGGGTGSGKTTVAHHLLQRYAALGCTLLSHDSYYRGLDHLPLAARHTANFDHPDALDHQLYLEHVQALIEGATIERPCYDFTIHSRTPGKVRLEPALVLVLEGVLIFWDIRLRSLMTCRLFIDSAPDLRFIRRLQRDIQERGRSVDSVVTQYLETTRPMHAAYTEPLRQFADLVVVNDGDPQEALQEIDTYLDVRFPPGSLKAKSG